MQTIVCMKPTDALCLAGDAIAVPSYLSQTYWWAYVHPKAVRLFERQWLLNFILLGNLARLRDAALEAMGRSLTGRSLQIGCVYGDLTRKLEPGAPVRLVHADSARLGLAPASYERALLFFLLHEQPAQARKATLAEALRVLKPGGCLTVVDYHRPRRCNPLYWPMAGVLRALEPYAMDLWQHEISEWLPRRVEQLEKATAFGGLYQIVRVTV